MIHHESGLQIVSRGPPVKLLISEEELQKLTDLINSTGCERDEAYGKIEKLEQLLLVDNVCRACSKYQLESERLRGEQEKLIGDCQHFQQESQKLKFNNEKLTSERLLLFAEIKDLKGRLEDPKNDPILISMDVELGRLKSDLLSEKVYSGKAALVPGDFRIQLPLLFSLVYHL